MFKLYYLKSIFMIKSSVIVVLFPLQFHFFIFTLICYCLIKKILKNMFRNFIVVAKSFNQS